VFTVSYVIVLHETSHDTAEDGVCWPHQPAIKPKLNDLSECTRVFVSENCFLQPCRQQHTMAQDVDQDSLTSISMKSGRDHSSEGTLRNNSLLNRPFSSSYHHHPLYFFGLAGPPFTLTPLRYATLYGSLPLLTRVSHSSSSFLISGRGSR
jgi:hypothetical protein